MQENLNIIKLDANFMTNGTFTATLKKWGSSIGVVVPKEILDEQELKVGQKVTFIVLQTDMKRLEKLFGTLKTDLTTDEILADDEEWDDD